MRYGTTEPRLSSSRGNGGRIQKGPSVFAEEGSQDREVAEGGSGEKGDTKSQ